jgi:hypothetical protein
MRKQDVVESAAERGLTSRAPSTAAEASSESPSQPLPSVATAAPTLVPTVLPPKTAAHKIVGGRFETAVVVKHCDPGSSPSAADASSVSAAAEAAPAIVGGRFETAVVVKHWERASALPMAAIVDHHRLASASLERLPTRALMIPSQDALTSSKGGSLQARPEKATVVEPWKPVFQQHEGRHRPALYPPKLFTGSRNKLQPTLVTTSQLYYGYAPEQVGGQLGRQYYTYPPEQLPGSSPYCAVDGNSATIWNSGQYFPQAIQLDLGRPFAIRRLRLQVSQYPRGETWHEVQMGFDVGALVTVLDIRGETYDDQWLDFTFGGKDPGSTKAPTGNIRFIRIVTTSSPSWVAWKEIEVYAGLEYFGYFADAWRYNGTGDYMSETVPAGANLVWIDAGAEDDLGLNVGVLPGITKTPSTLAGKLLEAAQLGAQAILAVPRLFFDDHGRYRDTADTDWQTLVDIIANGPPNMVSAFYLADEPPTNNIPPDLLEKAATRIRVDYPDTPIASFFSDWSTLYFDENTGSEYISMLDWVGVDFNAWPPVDHTWDFDLTNGVPWHLDKLRSWLSPSQRMMAMPRASLFGQPDVPLADVPRGCTEQAVLIDEVYKWQQEILSDPNYIAVVPFMWQSGYDVRAFPYRSDRFRPRGGATIGTADLPLLKKRLFQLARTLFW